MGFYELLVDFGYKKEGVTYCNELVANFLQVLVLLLVRKLLEAVAAVVGVFVLELGGFDIVKGVSLCDDLSLDLLGSNLLLLFGDGGDHGLGLKLDLIDRSHFGRLMVYL